MISGHVNSHDEPVVPITLVVGWRRHRRRAVIDTGFNGYLSIPEPLSKGWYYSGVERFEIATGDLVEQKVYLGRIVWDGRIRDVYAVTSHAQDILVGTKLLQGYKLLIDFQRKKVAIRRAIKRR